MAIPSKTEESRLKIKNVRINKNCPNQKNKSIFKVFKNQYFRYL